MTAHKLYQTLRSFKQQGLSITEAADRLGMTRSQFYYWRRKSAATYPKVSLKRHRPPRAARPLVSESSADTHVGTCVEFVTWA